MQIWLTGLCAYRTRIILKTTMACLNYSYILAYWIALLIAPSPCTAWYILCQKLIAVSQLTPAVLIHSGHISYLWHQSFLSCHLISIYYRWWSDLYMVVIVCGISSYHTGLTDLLILNVCLIFWAHSTWICWGRAMVAVLCAKLCWAWGTAWVISDKPCVWF